jgi:putative ABC transport system permease protein
MKPFAYLRRGRKRIQSEIDEELRVHLDMRVDDLIVRGMQPVDTRREALKQFGDMESTREYCLRQDEEKERRMQRALWVDDLVQDLRIGLRGLVRAPLMAAVIILTVGLGLGATTAIFAAIDAALLRPLPYANADRLVRIYTDAPPNQFPFSVADYLALQAQQTKFEQVAAYTGRQMSFTDGTTAELLPGRAVSWTYFSVLGVKPALGRDFVETDGRPNSQPGVIVSHDFWQQRLGGRVDAVGRPIQLDGGNYLVVGVLPATVGPLEDRQQLFAAVQFQTPPRKGPFFLRPIARLKRDANPTTALEELHAINRRIFPIWRASYQDDRATWGMRDLRSAVVGDVGAMAGLALAAVALVWIIACANASNLLVARVTSRRRELAVRAALGASRGRVIRYLLAESALLAVGAAAIGLAVAYGGVSLLRTVGVAYLPRTAEVALDGRVAWLLVGLTVASALLFGAVPAIQGGGQSGDRIEDALRSSGRSSTGTANVRRLRRLLVGSQFAIATPLLVAAGLLLVSLGRLGRVDLGFDTHNVLTASILLPQRTYPPERTTAFWPELQRRLEAAPGVAAFAYADGRPPNDVNNFNNFDLEDAPTPSGRSQPVVPWLSVSPEYFHVLGISLLQGRLLDQRDSLLPTTAEQPVVVDRAWVRRFFPDRNPIGRRMQQGGCTTCPWTVVVGVVSEAKYAGLDKPDEGTIYAPLVPQTRARFLVVRTTGRSSSVTPVLRATVRALDASLPLSGVATIDDLVDESLARPRSLSMLIGALAAVALALSVVGIYGVMTHYVQQHTKEIGIRLALGGDRRDVFRLIVGQGMTVVLGGLVVGLVGALAAAQAMSSLLFGISANDVLTFAIVTGVLTIAAFGACTLPARRAIAVEPASVLRDE